MLHKLILALLLSIIPALGIAAPSEEQVQFCSLVAANTKAAAEAKQVLGMSEEDFKARKEGYVAHLQEAEKNGVLTNLQVQHLINAIVAGWKSKAKPIAAANKAFEDCMRRKEV